MYVEQSQPEVEPPIGLLVPALKLISEPAPQPAPESSALNEADEDGSMGAMMLTGSDRVFAGTCQLRSQDYSNLRGHVS